MFVLCSSHLDAGHVRPRGGGDTATTWRCSASCQADTGTQRETRTGWGHDYPGPWSPTGRRLIQWSSESYMIMIAPQYLDLTLEEVLVRCYRAVHCNPGDEDYEIHPTSIFTPLRLDLPCLPHSTPRPWFTITMKTMWSALHDSSTRKYLYHGISFPELQWSYCIMCITIRWVSKPG